MTDEELGRHLAPGEKPEVQLRIVAALVPEQRAAYERLVEVAFDLEGGRRPRAVIVCR